MLGDRRDGLHVVHQHFDLFVLELVLELSDVLCGRIVAFGDSLHELGRRDQLQSGRVRHIDKDGLRRAYGNIAELAIDLTDQLAVRVECLVERVGLRIKVAACVRGDLLQLGGDCRLQLVDITGAVPCVRIGPDLQAEDVAGAHHGRRLGQCADGLVGEVVIAQAIEHDQCGGLKRAHVAGSRLERMRVGVRIRQDDVQIDALAAQLLDQVAVKILDGQHSNGLSRARAIGTALGLADQRQAIAVELERKALVDATHLHLARRIEDPGVESCAVDTVPDQGTGAGLLG